jgi:polar amino acid transport system substrate-binding protein
MFKKIAAAVLSAVMALSMCACSSGSGSADKTDWEYISDKGNLVIGITYYQPMNYLDDNGELTGFETEFAKAVCEKLGVEPVFQVIEWDKKEMELNAKTIDVIWNGLTVTEERKENMAFSTAYIRNRQVAVIKASNADKYPDLASMAGASVAAESGSAGQDAIEGNEVLSANEFVGASAQKDVLMEVKAGTSEIGVIDYVMAKASIGENTDYSDLMMVDSVELTPEEYAVGLRLSDTETLSKINAAIDEMAADGSLLTLCEKYDLADVYAFAEE